jgi:hypothetical protein
MGGAGPDPEEGFTSMLVFGRSSQLLNFPSDFCSFSLPEALKVAQVQPIKLIEFVESALKMYNDGTKASWVFSKMLDPCGLFRGGMKMTETVERLSTNSLPCYRGVSRNIWLCLKSETILFQAPIMKIQALSFVQLFFLFALSIHNVSSVAIGSAISRLNACVKNALIDPNPSSRIVGPTDDTYPDARTGTIV